MSHPQITVIGSLNVDLVTYTPRLPRSGETLTASSFTTALGGKGANQAVACSKLSRPHTSPTSGSVDVSMVGAVGSDVYGTAILTGMSSLGVDCSTVHIRDAPTKTGVAVILVEEDTGENRILLSPEANHILLPAHFDVLPTPRPDLLILQLEIPLPTVLHIIQLAASVSPPIPVLLNPAPAQPLPRSCYPNTAHLIVNESEAALLASVPESTLDTREGLARVARTFRQLGAQNVVITLGPRGAYFLGVDGAEDLVPAEKAKVVDTTAAGDTFIGGYALEVVRHQGRFDMARAVRLANHAAAKTVERKGAQESIPWSDEL